VYGRVETLIGATKTASVMGVAWLASLAATVVLTSPAFGSGQAMPRRYTCDGADVSPPLHWTAPPAGTRSLEVRLVDVDTHPDFLHWDVAGIPGRLRGIPAAAHVGRPRRSDFGRIGYGGPCPPPGQTHRYVFQLIARDARRHVVARARLEASYGRG
jgi:Raf kinase inhibitor-like YbhB/YbcL family protein